LEMEGGVAEPRRFSEMTAAFGDAALQHFRLRVFIRCAGLIASFRLGAL